MPMKKILFLLAIGFAFAACDDQTEITLETKTSILYVDALSDGTREIECLWTDLSVETKAVEITVKLSGWESDKPRKFRIYQSNKPMNNTYVLFAWPGETYEDFAETYYEIPAGAKEVKIPITLLKDENRLTNYYVNTINKGYTLQVAVSPDDLDDNLRAASAADFYMNIRVWNKPS